MCQLGMPRLKGASNIIKKISQFCERAYRFHRKMLFEESFLSYALRKRAFSANFCAVLLKAMKKFSSETETANNSHATRTLSLQQEAVCF